MNLPLTTTCIFIAFFLVSSCQSTPNKSRILQLESNQSDTVFWVDGVKVEPDLSREDGTYKDLGKFVDVRINNGEIHTIEAKPKGYKAKTQRIHPPYNSINVLSFYFTLADKETKGNPLPPSRLPTPPIYNPDPDPGTTLTPIEQVDTSGKYYALLIGNSVYENFQNLETPSNDVRVLSSVLEKHFGFETQVLLDATRAELLSTLNSYRTKLTTNEKFLVYFAGHGILDRDTDEGYWLPVDADNTTVNWLPSSVISQEIRAFDSKHVLVISDSCYSGKLTRYADVARIQEKDLRDKKRFLKKMLRKKSRMVMTSGGEEPVLDKGGEGGKHSIFADELIKALKSAHTMVTSSQIFEDVQYRVTTNSDQTPEFAPINKADHEGGVFVFVKK